MPSSPQPFFSWSSVWTLVIAAIVFFAVATWYDIAYTYYTYRIEEAEKLAGKAPQLGGIPLIPHAMDPKISFQHKLYFGIIWTVFVVVVLLVANYLSHSHHLWVKAGGLHVGAGGHAVDPLDAIIEGGVIQDPTFGLLRTVLPP